jgi:glycosyltransferase involved in cell wall biosynthesis
VPSRLKILISAIACDPVGGSEGAVGWNAVRRIAANHHDVRILASPISRGGWDRAFAEGLVPENIRVRFVGTDKPWHPNRFIGRLQSWTRYLAFNRQVLAAAQAWYEEEPFDLAHHLTYATWRVPSPLWRLPVPFVWGPIAGAAQFPRAFHSLLSPSARFFEQLRDLSSAIARRSKAFDDCVRQSAVVIAANEETHAFLKPYRGDKPLLTLPVAFLTPETIEKFRRPDEWVRPDGPLRLFAGGNMIGSKGLAIAVRALRLIKDQGIPFHYVIAGGGPEIPNIQNLVRQLDLQAEITFHEGYAGQEYVKALHTADVYFLPSFREALGLTMIEAVLAGCYPLVADASMPGEIIRAVGGSSVATRSIDQMSVDLARQISVLSPKRVELLNEAKAIHPDLVKMFAEDNYVQTCERAWNLCLPSLLGSRHEEDYSHRSVSRRGV